MRVRILLLSMFFMLSLVIVPGVKAEVQSQTTDDLAAELVTLLALAGDNAGTRWEQFSPAQQDLVLQYLKPNLYKQGKKVKLVAFKDVFVKFAPPPFTNPFSTSAATGYSISNVKRGWTTRYTLATSVSGNAPSCCQSTLSLTSQYGWSNSFNANVGVSAQVVTAGIGFDVTLSGSSTYQYSLNMPPNTSWEIDAYHKHLVTDYDVWFTPLAGNPYKAGSGQAFEFRGVSYSVWQVK